MPLVTTVGPWPTETLTPVPKGFVPQMPGWVGAVISASATYSVVLSSGNTVTPAVTALVTYGLTVLAVRPVLPAVTLTATYAVSVLPAPLVAAPVAVRVAYSATAVQAFQNSGVRIW